MIILAIFDREERVVLILLALLIGQAEQAIQPSPDQIMEKAWAKNISDGQALKRYSFDVIRNQKLSDGQSDEDGVGDRVTIQELFGRDRYRYELLGSFVIGERQMYMIDFSPAAKQPSTPDNASRRGKIKNLILNHLRGVIYVDKADYGIARVITHVHKPPAKIYKVGRLYVMEAMFEQVRREDIWVPSEVIVAAEYSYFLGIKRSRENTRIRFENYQPKAP
ncbi:MAG: hypothetical protein UY20_C0013G0008 [Candidatus Yanofskybacteria bacterium GW2011_GWA1_48_10]|uniref:Uncharacterized protein n=2 Tax=Candidatus Yanofskyibacteriota TaxID=1752733 RepID=A0A0G1U5L9_9BACT|nr:MAG: hypothetical protein UY20_C0013G0008 [Candidatus Yanofskybacteria bacterium GW2011_GWA1_48_10]OGN07477.1 MAG: hypothetical protein A2669_02045 [Candidatus Yanofskybacteria bacterium RIFCSPHIGHO2_01_FULL_48_25b]